MLEIREYTRGFSCDFGSEVSTSNFCFVTEKLETEEAWLEVHSRTV